MDLSDHRRPGGAGYLPGNLAAGLACGPQGFDLLDPVATAATTQAAIDELGGVDVLVNSAGILRFGSLLELTVQDWNETFSINTRAMLTTMQVTARWMMANDVHGKMINLASMAAKKGGAGEGAYPASKAKR